MYYLSRFNNKQLKFIRNGSKYLRKCTVRNDLKTYLIAIRVKFPSKQFQRNIGKIPNYVICGYLDYVVYMRLLLIREKHSEKKLTPVISHRKFDLYYCLIK